MSTIISEQKSHTLPQKSPTKRDNCYHIKESSLAAKSVRWVFSKEPHIFAKEPYVFAKEPYTHKRAVYLRKRSLYLRKKALYFRQKALYFRVRALKVCDIMMYKKSDIATTFS